MRKEFRARQPASNLARLLREALQALRIGATTLGNTFTATCLQLNIASSIGLAHLARALRIYVLALLIWRCSHARFELKSL
jgi:hypothetical protein